jgi:hypothetical protein
MANSMCYNFSRLQGKCIRQFKLGTKYLHFCGNSRENGIPGILLGFKGKYCNIMTSFFVQLPMGGI